MSEVLIQYETPIESTAVQELLSLREDIDIEPSPLQTLCLSLNKILANESNINKKIAFIKDELLSRCSTPSNNTFCDDIYKERDADLSNPDTLGDILFLHGIDFDINKKEPFSISITSKKEQDKIISKDKLHHNNYREKVFLGITLDVCPISSDTKLATPSGSHAFGSGRKGYTHEGIDYATPSGTPILASGDGIIEEIRTQLPNGKVRIQRLESNGSVYDNIHTAGEKYSPLSGLTTRLNGGNYIRIRHSDNVATAYAHIQTGSYKDLSIGEQVTMGKPIAKVGSTGPTSTGAHLHFEVIVKNGDIHQYTNPLSHK